MSEVAIIYNKVLQFLLPSLISESAAGYFFVKTLRYKLVLDEESEFDMAKEMPEVYSRE